MLLTPCVTWWTVVLPLIVQRPPGRPPAVNRPPKWFRLSELHLAKRLPAVAAAGRFAPERRLCSSIPDLTWPWVSPPFFLFFFLPATAFTFTAPSVQLQTALIARALSGGEWTTTAVRCPEDILGFFPIFFSFWGRSNRVLSLNLGSKQTLGSSAARLVSLRRAQWPLASSCHSMAKQDREAQK